ncbi:MAG: hypothetical protein EPN79_11740 [Burkholderiaceae bacterium]|nr:MAG: hypothetical protein EPN79_11740 [Burkholderiaceae bacterium]TBR76671.1 MAG: hypothetical protein EPN64_05325 [Burkholderiaceae bacterium]
MATIHRRVIAEKIQALMHKGSKDVVTFSWAEFYDVAERERIKETFKENLASDLRKLSMLINYGQSIVLVAKDFRFAPLKA